MNRILIRATNWVGDVVMSLPAIRAVAQRYPQSEITVLARPSVIGLYERERSTIHRVLPYTPGSGWKNLRAKWSAARELRQQGFQQAILLQNAFEAAAVARLAGIPQIIGYNRDGRGWLLTASIPVPCPGEIPRHERFYYLELLHRAGIIDQLPPDEPIHLENLHEARKTGTLRFAQMRIYGPVIGVSPGAAYGNAKRWLPERFAESASEIARQMGATVAVFGSASERDLCEYVAGLIGDKGKNLAGQTSLRVFIEMTAACRLFLTNDSGAMHIASAVGVPTVTVFGATDHTTTGPTGNKARIVREDVECSPCLLRECPIDHRCMTRVSSARVMAIALALLEGEGRI